MKKNLILMFIFNLMNICTAQNKFELKGFVLNSDNEQPIEDVQLILKPINDTIYSDKNGFYSINLSTGNYTISINKNGFYSETQTISIDKITTQDFVLVSKKEDEELSELIIDANINRVDTKDPQMSVNTLTSEEIKKLPVILGETDILKSLTLLPGVSSSGEASSGFNVRGGGSDQNLLLLDNTNVFSSTHLYGFFSVFNNDAVNDIKLYKGLIPAKYGGRISSVLEINQKTGDSEKMKLNGGIGLLSSRLTVEGPIIKDKLTYLVSGRGSYAHLFLKFQEDINSSAYFYDVNAKLSYFIDANNQIFFSGYFGNDVFNFEKLFDNEFGNTVLSLNYKHNLSPNLEGDLYTNYTDYRYKLKLDFVGFDWLSGINNQEIKYLLNHTISENTNATYGLQSQAYTFNPGIIKPTSADSPINEYQIPKKYAVENAFSTDFEQKISEKINLNAGLRYSQFLRLGKENINQYGTEGALHYNSISESYELGKPIGIKEYDSGEIISFYHNLEPRVAIAFETNPEQSIKASYAKTSQYIHLISNTSQASPLDVWAPSGTHIQPQISNQYAVGFFQNFKNDSYSLEFETYYKHGKNRLDYIDGANLIGNRAIEQVLLSGKTRAYGAEFLLRKNSGKLTGWIAYTLSRSVQKTEGRTPEEKGINNGKWYRSPIDRLHDLTAVAMYSFNKKWSVSANFTLQSGRAVTFPTGKYQIYGLTIVDYGDRNKNSLPNFHHLDISATYTPKAYESKRWKGEWIFSVYNIYNRKNAASINFRSTEQMTNEAVKLSIFGIVPSVTYNFKF